MADTPRLRWRGAESLKLQVDATNKDVFHASKEEEYVYTTYEDSQGNILACFLPNGIEIRWRNILT